MRLQIGAPPTTPDFKPEETGWTPLKEPDPVMLQLVATPIGIVAAVLCGIGWQAIGAATEVKPSPAGTMLLLLLLGFPALIAIHELIHACGYPRCGLTGSTVIAAWPSRLLFYAICLDPLSRNRLLLVFALPLLVISCLPLAVCGLLGARSGLLIFASVANSLMCGGDILGFLLVLFQVPRSALVRNQGWTTWWKAASR